MSSDVYRAAKLPEPVEPPPSELVYVATNHEKKGVQFAWMQLFVLPALLGAFVAAFHVWLGLVVMIGAVVYSHRFRKKSVTRAGAVLRVSEGEVAIYTRTGVAPLARVKLRDIADIRLDVRTIRRVQDGDSMVAAVRFTSTSVGPAIDQARIVLVGRKTKKKPDPLVLNLTDEYFAHLDSSEWLGKIRVFLRKHGWVPLDERKKEKATA